MAKKKLSDFPEVEFPEDPSTEQSKNTKNRKTVPSRREAKAKKKAVRRDIAIIAVFLILSVAGVILVNRFFPGNEGEKGTEVAGSSLTADRGTEEESGTANFSDPEPVTEPETEPVTSTEPPTEPPTEAPTVTEPPTEAPTAPPTEAPTEAPTEYAGTEPRMYPYTPLTPGLSIPVQSGITMPTWITQDLLRPGADSRPGTQIGEIKHVVVHYVGNVGSSAKDNRDYFEGNVDGRKVSSHFVVGMYGEIIQCIPLNEVAYAQGIRQELVNQGMINHNYDSISIENCHPYSNGQFTSDTYWALVKLCAWLLEKYGLGPDALMRHYDATTNAALGIHGKGCPLYFTEHPEAWEQFKTAVGQYMIEYPNIQ